MDNAPPPPKKVPANSSQPYGRPFGLPVIIMLILAGLAIVTILAREQSAAPETISYDAFVREVKAGNG